MIVREKNTKKERKKSKSKFEIRKKEEKTEKKLTAPKMTLAAGSASDETTCDTSLTSAKVMSLPPVML